MMRKDLEDDARGCCRRKTTTEIMTGLSDETELHLDILTVNKLY